MGKNLIRMALIGLLTATSFGAWAQAEAMQPLTINDVRVLFEEAVQKLRERIKNSENLPLNERVETAIDVEEEAERIREQLDQVVDDAARLGDRHLLFGVMVTYQGEYNVPTMMSAVQVAPGAETGIALFLKKNAFLSESIRGTSVAVGSVSGQLAPRGILPRERALEHGMKLKLLFARNNADHTAVSLSAFEGFYTGVSAKLELTRNWDLGALYTKPQTCVNANPLNCSVYMIALGSKNRDQAGFSAEVRQMYVNFPHSNDKRGWHF